MDRDIQLALLDRIQAHRRAGPGATDLAPASAANPVHAYLDEERFEAERERFFRGLPIVAGLSCDLREPGSYLTFELDGVPLLLTRDTDGTARAFRNVCRHRGCRVASGRGCTPNVLTCPYHAWTYALDGSLAQISSRSGFDDLNRETLALSPVACGEAAGFVFVCLAANPSRPLDAAAWLGEAGHELAGYGLEGYHHVETRTNARSMNWKLMVDTFGEGYHIQSLHKRTIAPMIMSTASVFDAFGPHGRWIATRWSIEELDSLEREHWDLLPHATILYLLAPNTVFIQQQDHVELWQIFPGATVDEASTLIHLYAPTEPTTERELTHWRRNMDLLVEVTDTEDFIMCEEIQQGFRSGAQDGIVFGRNEPALIHYHRSLNELLGEG